MSSTTTRSYSNNNNNDNKASRFLGGAERARKNAQKRKLTHHHHHHHNSTPSSSLPKSLPPTSRFYASLLSLPLSSYLLSSSSSSSSSSSDPMPSISQRSGLPFPTRSPSQYPSARSYYASRASLVLDESQFVLSEALSKQQRRRGEMMMLRLVEAVKREWKKGGGVVLMFCKDDGGGMFSTKEIYDLKLGNVFEIGIDRSSEGDGVLGAVVPMNLSNGDNDPASIVPLVVYDQVWLRRNETILQQREVRWRVRALTTLISEQRQFVACWNSPKVAFMNKILGLKGSTHIRFDYSSDSSSDSSSEEDQKEKNEDDVMGEEKKDDDSSHSLVSNNTPKSSSSIIIPELNPTQEKAVVTFLNSPSSTLTLVQGPPGTGKTTFLTSILLRSILSSPHKRILVTAPTNKAITVLASRFLYSLNDTVDYYNVILIGVEDKLIIDDDDDGIDDASSVASLKRIFVYTWIDELCREFKRLSHRLLSSEPPTFSLLSTIRQNVHQLIRKLERSLPSWSKQSGVSDAARALVFEITQFVDATTTTTVVFFSKDPSSTTTTPPSPSSSQVRESFQTLLKRLIDGAKSDANQIIAELLATAHVIFSTLSSSGVAVMKRTKAVDDLFVDEAAACTEPELLIPFHLRPSRLLMVGDPKQLPATVLNPRAVKFGLDRSMMHRLMYDLDVEFVMLDVQYRMRPEIRCWPGGMFYGGMLRDGEMVTSDDYRSSSTASILDGRPYTFLNVFGNERQTPSGSYYNDAEAQVIRRLLLQLLHQSQNTAASSSSSSSSSRWDSPERIRIITFYQGQVVHIRRILDTTTVGGKKGLLRNVLVATVDSSQGCEADIVIVSFVRSQTTTTTHRGRRRRYNDKNENKRQRRSRLPFTTTAGFLRDDRRMNVALTRAKYQLICVGDALGTLVNSGVRMLEGMVEDAKMRGVLENWEGGGGDVGR